MAYQTNYELPASIRNGLSDAAQTLYRFAFNSAMQWYGEEAKAHKTAWNAVRSQAVSLNSTIGNLE
jgi:cation transport regulator